MLPAYIANPAAALFGGGKPVDLGKKFRDDRRILGDGKTYRGFIMGSMIGASVGALQLVIAPHIAPCFAEYVDPEAFTSISYLALITLPVGALIGDMAKSFIKRRMGYERGQMLPLADQLDFVIGAWILTYIVDPSWMLANFTIGIIITVLLITPILHLSTNIIGFKIGAKKEPW
ncbi:CDP-2,3-bis-(O-geranylgeranyl)-sn-glycerol synthase [Methanooceanicella nereidis]